MVSLREGEVQKNMYGVRQGVGGVGWENMYSVSEGGGGMREYVRVSEGGGRVGEYVRCQ